MEYQVSIDRVVDAFLSLAGKETADESRVFCRTAAHTVDSWIDRSKDLWRSDGALCYAAATIAFYRYTLKNSGSAQSVKAGDITINDKSEKTVAYAKGLMQDALSAVEHLFKSKRFAFIKTEVL